MAREVKRRTYHSPRRQEQAAATRRRIIDAARTLWERDGYHATSMADIAEEAGVALKTVYVTFETRGGLLRAVWDLALKGDEHDAPVAARTWFTEILEERDPAQQLRLNARNARIVKSRIGGMFAVLRDAAPTDPEPGALWALIQREFHANQRSVVESVASKRALARGRTVEDAADLLWILNHPDVWLLFRARGWSAERFEAWLAETSIAQLLKPR